MQKNTHSDHLSFLDVIFGALGAVLILFIIMLSMFGAPPRQRTPLNRVYKWEIEFPEGVSFSDDQLRGELLICNDNLNDPERDWSTPINMTPISGLGFQCPTPDETPVPTDIGGSVLVQKETDAVTRKTTVIVNLELTQGDECWEDTLILKLNNNQWERSTVSVSPGETGKASKTIENTNSVNEETCFLSIVPLVQQDDGLMPNINKYLIVVREKSAE